MNDVYAFCTFAALYLKQNRQYSFVSHPRIAVGPSIGKLKAPQW